MRRIGLTICAGRRISENPRLLRPLAMRRRLVINDRVHSPCVKSGEAEAPLNQYRRENYASNWSLTPRFNNPSPNNHLLPRCRADLPSRSAAERLPDDQALKTRTDLVNVGVLARQKKTGRIVTNLIKDDFTIFEDGVRQTVSYFSQERLPLSIILLVDRAGCINAFNDRIRAATIKAFGDLKPEDEVAIMTFSNKVALAQPFTRLPVDRRQDRGCRAAAPQRTALLQRRHIRGRELHKARPQIRRAAARSSS